MAKREKWMFEQPCFECGEPSVTWSVADLCESCLEKHTEKDNSAQAMLKIIQRGRGYTND